MNGNLIIKNASELVTCSGFKPKKGKEMAELHVIPNGAIIIKEGNIETVGTTEKIDAELNKSVSDLSGFDIIDA